jgi:hypothetical protein
MPNWSSNMLRQGAQVLCVSVILGGVFCLAQFGRPSPPSSSDVARTKWSRAWSSTNESDRVSELCSMPACVELQGAIERLQGARTQLLQSAAEQGGRSAVAAEEYRESVHRFQTALGRVKDRVRPEELAIVFNAFGYDAQVEGIADLSLAYHWELGSYSQEVAP